MEGVWTSLKSAANVFGWTRNLPVLGSRQRMIENQTLSCNRKGFLEHNSSLVMSLGHIFPPTRDLLNKHSLSWKSLRAVLFLKITSGERIAQSRGEAASAREVQKRG